MKNKPKPLQKAANRYALNVLSSTYMRDPQSKMVMCFRPITIDDICKSFIAGHEHAKRLFEKGKVK